MQPLVNLVMNFDANNEHEFRFTYLGTEQITTNELSIREDKLNSQPVYVRQSTKFDKSHVLPRETLENGKSYLVKVRVQLENTWSEWSVEQPFLCLETPSYVFENLHETKYIYNNDVLMNIIFRQAQGDRVDTFRFVLMDQNKIPIKKYPTRRPRAEAPNILQERISDLIKGKLYYIGCYVTTINNVNFFDSHEFIPHFVAPGSPGNIVAHNQEDSGQVLVQSFLRQNTGIQTTPFIPDSDNSEPINYAYIDNEWVVIPPSRPLMFKKMGMAKSSDFVVKLWCKNVINGKFLYFTEEDDNGIGLSFIKHDDYIVCEKEFLNDSGMGIKSRYRSNVVPNLKLKEFFLYIKVFEYRLQIEIQPV